MEGTWLGQPAQEQLPESAAWVPPLLGMWLGTSSLISRCLSLLTGKVGVLRQALNFQSCYEDEMDGIKHEKHQSNDDHSSSTRYSSSGLRASEATCRPPSHRSTHTSSSSVQLLLFVKRHGLLEKA